MIKVGKIYYMDGRDIEMLGKDEAFAKKMDGRITLPLKYSQIKVENQKGEEVLVTLQCKRPGSRKMARNFRYNLRNKWGQPKCNNYGSFKGTPNGKGDRWLRSVGQDYHSAVFDYNEALDEFNAFGKCTKTNKEAYNKAFAKLDKMESRVPVI